MEKYDCTKAFKLAFWRNLPNRGSYHYHAYRQMDGGKIFNKQGIWYGQISWTDDGKSMTLTLR